MTDFDGLSGAPDMGNIRDALERHAAGVRQWAHNQIEAIEKRRDEELRRAEGALACVEPPRGQRSERRPRRPSPASGKRSQRSRRSPSSTTPAAVHERCEAVAGLLLETKGSLAHGEICRRLNLTPHTVTTALKRLVDEGRAERRGSGPKTRYQATASARAATSLGLGSGGSEATAQGQIVATLQSRGWASADELAQTLGIAREEVVAHCGVLLGDGVIRMDRREGRSVYVYQRPS